MADGEGLPFDDTDDFTSAERGFIGALDPGIVHNKAGRGVGTTTYAFLKGDAPDTVHPSLWRQSSLVAEQGLFEVPTASTRFADSTCRTSRSSRATPASSSSTR